MPDYADLEMEIGLAPGAAPQTYQVTLRFKLPGANTSDREGPVATQLDLSALGALADKSADGCGAELIQRLLPTPQFEQRFANADGKAGGKMRVRLLISRDAPELHALRWEALHLPGATDVRLAVDENRPLSRYLINWDDGLNLPPKGIPRALAVIANPTGVSGLAPVDVADELARARKGLGDIPTTVLCRLPAGTTDPDCAGLPTIDTLVDQLSAGYDILYLVGHGELVGGTRPRLLLEEEDGSVGYVEAADVTGPGGQTKLGLAAVLRAAQQRPRLIVLTACQSAGAGSAWADRSALRAMGPQLVWAGVPAVIAMQGSAPMDMVADFMPKFFTELRRDGLIDRAVAAARQFVIARGHDPWWMPVLFMRLLDGQLNLKQGLDAPFMAGDLRGYVSRPALLAKVRDKLVDTAGEGHAIALHGFGGFGKTTLACAICHDPAVKQAFPGGILWATLGQQSTEGHVLYQISRLYEALGGEPQLFPRPEDAARALGKQLGEKRCLMVIDDVWDLEILEHFREGGPNCTRLITTRQFDVAVAASDDIPIDEMTVSEGAQTLALQMEPYPTDLTALEDLAVQLGRWPLLLALASPVLRKKLKSGATLAASVQMVQADLAEEGLFAFDKDRTSAKTIRMSMDQLGDEADRERLLQLAIFPPDVDVPLPQAQRLWGVTESKTRRVAEDLRDLSLAKLDLQNGTLNLHAVMREYLVQQLEKRPDPASLHLELVDAWGAAPALPDRYARRWAAYHLSEAVRLSDPQARPGLVERLVRLLNHAAFQTAYLADFHDAAGLQRDLEQARGLAGEEVQRALDLNPIIPELAALPELVTAARGLPAFRRDRLNPTLIFDLARSGDVGAARRQLGIFGAEREWRLGAQLIIAWLAAPRRSLEAKRLFDSLGPELGSLDRLQHLADRVQSTLLKQQPVVDDVSEPGTAEVQEVVLRMAGMAVQLGEAYEGSEGMSELRPGTANSYEASAHIRPESNEEAFTLIRYTRYHREEGRQHVEDYVDILAANAYVQYRNQFLWPLLELVARYAESPLAEDLAARIAAAALAPNRMEFEEALPITILALQAAALEPGTREDLDAYRDLVVPAAKLLEPDTSRGDAWGSSTRRLAALAHAFHLLGESAEAKSLWEQAERLHFGFAGFMAPARLTLAETMRACDAPCAEVDAVVVEAVRSAHNVEKPVFCAQTTARFNALQECWWAAAFDQIDLAQAATKLVTGPQAPEFAALHRVGEDYPGRVGPPPPPWAKEAHTLPELAVLYGRTVEELEAVNPGIKREEDLSTFGSPEFVNIPDPDLAPLLAARLAAAVMARVTREKMTAAEGVGAILKLVAVAAANGTALDTVLSRLLLVARPFLHSDDLKALAEQYADLKFTLAKRLAEDTATPQASESTWIP